MIRDRYLCTSMLKCLELKWTVSDQVAKVSDIGQGTATIAHTHHNGSVADIDEEAETTRTTQHRHATIGVESNFA